MGRGVPTDSAMEPAVFISYSRHDAAELARRLHCDIVDQGHEVWLDAVDLADGRTWTAEVERALDRTDVVLALLSRGSILSCHALPISAGVVGIVHLKHTRLPLVGVIENLRQ